MKTLVKLLFVAFLFSALSAGSAFSQNNEAPRFTKDEAIAVLRANYLFMYFKNPEDTTANIDRFIDNVDRIVPVDADKRVRLKTLILSVLNNMGPREPTANAELSQLLDVEQNMNYILLMGIGIGDILKHNFTLAEYETIYNELISERHTAKIAYYNLSKLYKEEPFNKDIVFVNWANPKGFLDKVFKYYGV